MMELEAKLAYWLVVEACLVRFFEFPLETATEEVDATIHQLNAMVPREIYYHDEPFNIACSVVGKPETRLEEFIKLYTELIDWLNRDKIELEQLGRMLWPSDSEFSANLPVLKASKEHLRKILMRIGEVS